MRERKDTWIKPKTTYCKDVDIFRSAVDDRNQFNGEWFTQIQLTVKKEMAWINDGTAALQLNARIPLSLSLSLFLVSASQEGTDMRARARVVMVEREGIIGMQHKLVALTEEWARALLRTRQAATSASSLQRSEISVKDIRSVHAPPAQRCSLSIN